MGALIRMPEVLAGVTEATLQSWLVGVGDSVAMGQPVAEVETDKAVVECAADQAGVLAGFLVDAGGLVSVGTPIAVVATGEETTEEAMAAAGPEAGSHSASGQGQVPRDAVEEEAAQVDVTSADRRFISPLVRRLARQHGLDLSSVQGSGPGGRIVRRDVQGLLAQNGAQPGPQPEVPVTAAGPAAAAGPTHSRHLDVPHTRMRRAIARRLTESTAQVPHFYLRAECHVDALLDLRAAINKVAASKISLNDLVLKAVAAAFRDVPEANVIWTPEAVRQYRDVDVAIAVAVGGGLVTPVLRDVARTPLSEVAAQVRSLSEQARAGRLREEDLTGGSFTVSNLGMHGVHEFAAIINPPHSGILAIGAVEQRPVVKDGQLAVGSMMRVTLSADHRALDGVLAARWLGAFRKHVEHPVSALI